MSEKPSISPVVYDAMNRELRTVRDYFAQSDEEVLNIKWQPEIEEGAQIVPGQLLAHIDWSGGIKDPLEAPSGCGGRIEWINGQIEYEKLDLRPEVLLRLEAG
ncbi:MAG: hypothetical protein ACE5OR_14550 [bacterium]